MRKAFAQKLQAFKEGRSRLHVLEDEDYDTLVHFLEGLASAAFPCLLVPFVLVPLLSTALPTGKSTLEPQKKKWFSRSLSHTLSRTLSLSLSMHRLLFSNSHLLRTLSHLLHLPGRLPSKILTTSLWKSTSTLEKTCLYLSRRGARRRAT